MKASIRVAAAQFHVGADLETNLQTCLRMLDQAAECQPDLVVLPEFCNHLSWYADKEHCHAVSVALDGPFLQAIADKARELGIHVVVNCTVQREGGRTTGSSLLYSPEGELLADNTKQIYIGHENDFLERAEAPGPVVETPLGRLGLYACMDGVINETPRTLALNGADLILNSLNSFASDEASLHIPVRAAENKVFVVAANKIGPLVPEELVGPISESTGIPPRFLDGAGESQVVAPDGTVLAKASLDREEVIWADINPALARDKHRPDGSDLFATRRPALYTPITDNPAGQVLPKMAGRSELSAVAVCRPVAAEVGAVRDAVTQAVAGGAELVCLPPLFGATDTPDVETTQALIDAIAAAAGTAHVATALFLADASGAARYSGALIGNQGLVLQQGQVHASAGVDADVLSDAFVSAELAGARVAVLCSQDTLYPETFRLLALQGVEVALVPLAPLEDWELATGLVERAAENRINLVAATAADGGLACSLQTDFTVMTEWQERPFDGLLSQPELSRFTPGELGAVVLRPANAANKVVSQNTDLLANRPWRAAAVISRA